MNEQQPTNLEELTDAIIKMLDEDSIEGIKDGSITSIQVHFSLGMHIRNHFGLWNADSVLSRWFKDNWGLWHADDMSGVAFDHVWAKLRGEEHDIQPQVDSYLEHWRNEGVT